jgi:3-oxoacyl-[acyl-carrier protein] reductase
MPNAIITGTSRGLGHALAEKLLHEGWNVWGLSRSSSKINHKHFSEHLIDITDEAAVQKAVAFISQNSPNIDLLVNNAGAASMNAFLFTPVKTAEALMRLNYLGTFHCLQAVGKLMVRQRCGLIINITTVAVPLALAGEAAYVASKAALDSLTKVTAEEFKSHGIMVIGLGFGPLDTDLIKAVNQEKINQLNQRIARPNGTTLNQATDFIFRHLDRKSLTTGDLYYLGKII